MLGQAPPAASGREMKYAVAIRVSKDAPTLAKVYPTASEAIKAIQSVIRRKRKMKGTLWWQLVAIRKDGEPFCVTEGTA